MPLRVPVALGRPLCKRNENPQRKKIDQIMKKRTIPQWLLTTVCGLALAGSMAVGWAQTAQNPQPFDTGAGSWITWNGWGLQSPDALGNTWLYWDSTRDASNNPNSGSLRYEVPFTGAGGDQIMTFGTLANRWGWDGGVVLNVIGKYNNLSLDLLIDPASPPTKNNDFGTFELGFTTDGWGQVNVTNMSPPLSVAGNWMHVVAPINESLAGLEKVNGFYVKIWSGGVFTNTFMFNIDNVWLEPAPSTNPPPPPPSLTLEKTIPGLNLIAAGTGQYDRQNIRDVNPVFSWVGNGNTPVNYSFTIKSFPGTNNPGFEVHSYLVPVPYDPVNGLGTIGADSAPDWDQTNCVFMDLQNQADSSAVWTFRWKTNSIPDGNGTYYSSPLAILNEPAGTLGTWLLSFVNDTNVTMTSPSGLTTNFVFSPDKLAGYVDNSGQALPLYYYIGAKPQQNINRGLLAVVSQVQITGLATNLNDNFLIDSTLDTNTWQLEANNGAAGVQLVPANAAYWLDWTLPDAGFSLQSSPDLNPTNWVDSPLTVLLVNAARKVLLSKSDLPGSRQGYWRLLKRAYTQLQVLMPGETAAPGTPTGKTGTPDPQSAAVAFNVVVNAVDATWHLITLAPNDSIALTSNDASALLPANAPLVGGTVTLSVTPMTAGSTFTVTATDADDNTKTPNTGTPITVTP